MSRAALFFLALCSACGNVTLECPEYTEDDWIPPPELGIYEMTAPVYSEEELESLPPEAIVDATAELREDEVVVEYTRSDGARFRVTYASTVEYR
jgi:hypothetical protein